MCWQQTRPLLPLSMLAKQCFTSCSPHLTLFHRQMPPWEYLICGIWIISRILGTCKSRKSRELALQTKKCFKYKIRGKIREGPLEIQVTEATFSTISWFLELQTPNKGELILYIVCNSEKLHLTGKVQASTRLYYLSNALINSSLIIVLKIVSMDETGGNYAKRKKSNSESTNTAFSHLHV